MQYSHRLPVDYDMQAIRDRAARRGPLWNDVEGLAFKAFVGRERGRDGAVDNLYASVYLWNDPRAAARLLAGDAFRSVTDTFGRPRVESWLPLHAIAGRAIEARSLQRLDRTLETAAEAATAFEHEHDWARDAAGRTDTVVAWSVLDPAHWRVLRFLLSSVAPGAAEGTQNYEVLHLAKPGLGRLE